MVAKGTMAHSLEKQKHTSLQELQVVKLKRLKSNG
jgi:hypothetical protein